MVSKGPLQHPSCLNLAGSHSRLLMNVVGGSPQFAVCQGPGEPAAAAVTIHAGAFKAQAQHESLCSWQEIL